MNAAARLAVFGAALVAVFALTFVGARAVAPSVGPSTVPSTAPAHGETGAGHGETGTGPEMVPGLSVEEQGYRISGVSAPTRVGAAGSLSFVLTGPDGRPVTRYTANHEKDLHLVVVRSDGAHFRDVHPRTDDHGGWSIPWRWTDAGTYRVFADFVPTDLGTNLTLTSAVQVTGTLSAARGPARTERSEVDGFTVARRGELTAGQESTLTFTVSRDGRPVTTLQPYLGAYGHLVALRSGDLGYLHVHPTGEPGDGRTEPGPEIAFRVEAPSAGDYLLYLDFRVDGVVSTAAFTVTAGSR